MNLIGVLVLLSAQPKNDLGFSFDFAQFAEADTAVRFELYYQLPVSGLTFVTEDTGFVARYRILVQFFNNRNELVTGEVWQRTDRRPDAESTIVDSVHITVPPAPYTLHLKVEDVGSTNFFSSALPVDLRPMVISGIRFLTGDRLNPGRTYRATDKLFFSWELYNPENSVDSMAILIQKGKKVMYTNRQRLGHAPLNSYTMNQDIENWQNGEYQITIAALDRKGKELFRRAANFSIENPFYISDTDYREKLDELLYIASPEEIKRLRGAPKEERLTAWQEFWKQKDPTPETPKNEAMDDYFTRIQYCKENFSKGDRGYRSDRAKVYVRYGSPDEIDSHPFELGSQAYEVWFYYDSGMKFTFLDRNGFGVYTLIQPQELQ